MHPSSNGTILNQVIVNVLLHNPDAHLKNYALLLLDTGKISVSPLYDSLCTYGLNFSATDVAWAPGAGPAAHTRNMSLWIGGATAIDQISQQDWAQFAIECGFTAAFVSEGWVSWQKHCVMYFHMSLNPLSGNTRLPYLQQMP